MRIESSEGKCHKCNQPIGISGTCWACSLEEMPMVTKMLNGPKCAECGGGMYHSRLHGYACMRSPDHKGMVWPSLENSQKE